MSRFLCALLIGVASLWLPLSNAVAAPPIEENALVAQGDQRDPVDQRKPPPKDPLDSMVKKPGADPQGSARRFPIRYHKRRDKGFGTALGGGAGGNFIGGTGLVQGVLLLPTLEMRFFRTSRHSFDVQIPILNMVLPLVLLATTGDLLLPLTVGLYYSIEFGRGNIRFILSPGAQVSVIIASVRGATAAGFELRPGVGLGLLVLTDSRGFEFQLRARPFIGVGLAAAVSGGATGNAFAFSAGGLAELAFIWY